MSDQQEALAEGAQPGVRSGVRIEMNAKGQAQPKVAVYEGTTEEEMQRIKDIAVRTFGATVREINATAGLQTP